MDNFCEWVKENMFIDLTHKEIHDISEAVHTLTNKIVCQFNKSTDDCKIQQLVRCGSMVEGTRIWGKHTRYVQYSENPDLLRIIEAAPEIEYDYLAVIDSTQSGNLMCEELCEEHVQFRDLKYNNTQKCVEHFKINVMTAIASLCKCYTFEVYEESDDIFFSNVYENAGFELCTVEMDTGILKVHAGMGYSVLQSFHFEFDWISKKKELSRPTIESDFNVSVENVSKLRIMLHLNPAIKIANVGKSSHVKSEMNCDQTSITGELYAFPKTCKDNHRNCWRISRCVSEVYAFRNANTEHKMCFITLKFICIFCNFGPVLNSYHIKSAIFHHMKTCSGANTSQCLQKVLCFLTEKMKIVNLLKFDTEYNLFSNQLPDCKHDIKLHGDLFEIVSQSRIWKDDHVFNMKLMTSLSFVFFHSPYTCYYNCKNIDRVLDQAKGAIEKHVLNCDWKKIRQECESICKENFELGQLNKA